MKEVKCLFDTNFIYPASCPNYHLAKLAAEKGQPKDQLSTEIKQIEIAYDQPVLYSECILILLRFAARNGRKSGLDGYILSNEGCKPELREYINEDKDNRFKFGKG